MVVSWHLSSIRPEVADYYSMATSLIQGHGRQLRLLQRLTQLNSNIPNGRTPNPEMPLVNI